LRELGEMISTTSHARVLLADICALHYAATNMLNVTSEAKPLIMNRIQQGLETISNTFAMFGPHLAGLV
jgi:hypothetical protein